MLKSVKIYECDVCGRTEQARTVSGRYNETDYTIPEGWSYGHNKNFILCDKCTEKLAKETCR